MASPPAKDVEELKKAVADADAVGLKGAQAEAARKVVQELQLKEQCLKKLRDATEQADEAQLKAGLQEAEKLRLKKEGAVQQAEAELKRIQEEKKHLQALAQALSLPPHPLAPGVSISAIGEVAISEAALRQLHEAVQAAQHFGVRTQAGKQALQTADVVQRVRYAIGADQWADVEALVAWGAQQAAQHEAHLPEHVPELQAALAQIALRRDIAATIENLQTAAAAFDAGALLVHIATAQRLEMQGVEAYEALRVAIVQLQEALAHAQHTRSLPDLDWALQQAEGLGYNREDAEAARQVREVVRGLVAEIEEHLRLVPEVEQLQELAQRCRLARTQTPEVQQLEGLLGLSDEELLKAQVKAATEQRDMERVLVKTSALKELYFRALGADLRWEQCPVLRAPLDFARAKVFGKEKLIKGMCVWQKSAIPTSLLLIQDRVRLLLSPSSSSFSPPRP